MKFCVHLILTTLGHLSPPQSRHWRRQRGFVITFYDNCGNRWLLCELHFCSSLNKKRCCGWTTTILSTSEQATPSPPVRGYLIMFTYTERLWLWSPTTSHCHSNETERNILFNPTRRISIKIAFHLASHPRLLSSSKVRSVRIIF